MGIRVLAKSALFRIPFLALMMRTSRQIRVDHADLGAWVRAMDEVAARLGRGETVHIFPEMTRCPRGFVGVRPFALAPFLAALKEGAMVLPIVIKGTDEVWPKGRFELNFRMPVHVRTLSPLHPADFASAKELMTAARQQIEVALQ